MAAARIGIMRFVVVGHLIGASCSGLGEICDREILVFLDCNGGASSSGLSDFGRYFITIDKCCRCFVGVAVDCRFLLFAGSALFGDGSLGDSDRRCLLLPKSAVSTTNVKMLW